MGHVYRFFIVKNQVSLQVPICIRIPSYKHNDISLVVTDDYFHSLSLLHSHCCNTIDISAVGMLGVCLFQFNTGSLAWVLCLLSRLRFFFLFDQM